MLPKPFTPVQADYIMRWLLDQPPEQRHPVKALYQLARRPSSPFPPDMPYAEFRWGINRMAGSGMLDGQQRGARGFRLSDWARNAAAKGTLRPLAPRSYAD